MTTIRTGFYIELSNRLTNRVIFSAATDQVTEATFNELWKAIGATIYRGIDESDQSSLKGYYELRVSPIT